jgi:osmotically-inducible protein OsmY
VVRPDDDIKRDVEEEIRRDPAIDIHDDIAVAVKKGVVMLTGFAVSYADMRAAEAAAKRVAGVVGLVNDIEVRLPGWDERSDPDIARDAVAMLRNDLPDVWEKIRVIVAKGRVTLEGEVAWNHQREAAANAVQWLKGVKRVKNLLRIVPEAEPRDIKREIEAALQRSAEIDSNRVRVEVRDGGVVLTGTVRSWGERQRAEQAAWSAPGVSKVENQLAVAG